MYMFSKNKILLELPEGATQQTAKEELQRALGFSLPNRQTFFCPTQHLPPTALATTKAFDQKGIRIPLWWCGIKEVYVDFMGRDTAFDAESIQLLDEAQQANIMERLDKYRKSKTLRVAYFDRVAIPYYEVKAGNSVGRFLVCCNKPISVAKGSVFSQEVADVCSEKVGQFLPRDYILEEGVCVPVEERIGDDQTIMYVRQDSSGKEQVVGESWYIQRTSIEVSYAPQSGGSQGLRYDFNFERLCAEFGFGAPFSLTPTPRRAASPALSESDNRSQDSDKSEGHLSRAATAAPTIRTTGTTAGATVVGTDRSVPPAASGSCLSAGALAGLGTYNPLAAFLNEGHPNCEKKK